MDGRWVVAMWLAASLLAIAGGVASVAYEWSGIPVQWGPIGFNLTLYPPLPIVLLLAVWIGPVWGMIPAYLATLALALYSGMPIAESMIFSLADIIHILVVWGGMVILGRSPALRSFASIRDFVALNFVASVASSLGALIWNACHDLPWHVALRIWQGWVVGAFLLSGVVVPLVLFVVGDTASRLLDRRLHYEPRHDLEPKQFVILPVLTFLLLSAIGVVVVWLFMESLADLPHELTGAELVVRIQELSLFVALLLASLLLTAILFAGALGRRSEVQQRLAFIDDLTGFSNRRSFEAALPLDVRRAARSRKGLSVVFFDLDRFKRINDRHGHMVGDEMLRELALRVSRSIRSSDKLHRWGGEEFVVLLPETPPDVAERLFDRVRASVADEPFTTVTGSRIQLTISAGVAGIAAGQELAMDDFGLVVAADEACYQAKLRGRNRVERAASTDLEDRLRIVPA